MFCDGDMVCIDGFEMIVRESVSSIWGFMGEMKANMHLQKQEEFFFKWIRRGREFQVQRTIRAKAKRHEKTVAQVQNMKQCVRHGKDMGLCRFGDWGTLILLSSSLPSDLALDLWS